MAVFNKNLSAGVQWQVGPGIMGYLAPGRVSSGNRSERLLSVPLS